MQEMIAVKLNAVFLGLHPSILVLCDSVTRLSFLPLCLPAGAPALGL
jgi:hypothetical protein